MKAEIKAVQGKSFEDALRRIDKDVIRAASDDMLVALEDGAASIQKDIILSMRNSPPDASRAYRRGGKRDFHSFPGNAPRVDTGNLIGSILIDVNQAAQEVEVGSIITDPPYPKYMEFGTPRGMIKPRPWLGPAWDKNEGVIKGNILEAARRATQ